MNKLDKMKKMVDGILGDDDLCEGCEDDDDNEIEQDGRITQEDPDDSKGISEAI